jgi:teichuronic acid exporter
MGNTKHYIWSAVDKFGTQIISFVSNILIARILSPDDYGLVAMLAIFTTIVMSLSDAGFMTDLFANQIAIKKILEQLHRIILQLPYLCLQ